MERLAIVVSLKEGAEPRAAELLAGGAPFDPGERGLERHSVYLSAGDVVFVFEGHEVEWILDTLVSEPYQWEVSGAFEVWRELGEGPPRIARPAYVWERGSNSRVAGAVPASMLS